MNDTTSQPYTITYQKGEGDGEWKVMVEDLWIGTVFQGHRSWAMVAKVRDVAQEVEDYLSVGARTRREAVSVGLQSLACEYWGRVWAHSGSLAWLVFLDTDRLRATTKGV